MNDNDLPCRLFVLALASLASIAALALMAWFGVSSRISEQLFMCVSVPWFALWYLLCRRWHRTRIVFVDDQEGD